MPKLAIDSELNASQPHQFAVPTFKSFADDIAPMATTSHTLSINAAKIVSAQNFQETHDAHAPVLVHLRVDQTPTDLERISGLTSANVSVVKSVVSCIADR